MANLYRRDEWVKSVQGPAVPGAQVYVLLQPANVLGTSTPTPLANIYSDPQGLFQIQQPAISDGFGHVDFYALPGLYTIAVFNGGVLQQYYPDQSIGNIGTGSTSSTVIGEIPSGTVNGINTNFALANTPTSGVAVYYDGIRFLNGVDFSVSGNVITFFVAPPVGSLLQVDYTILGS